jgi:hypothetical protein
MKNGRMREIVSKWNHPGLSKKNNFLKNDLYLKFKLVLMLLFLVLHFALANDILNKKQAMTGPLLL